MDYLILYNIGHIIVIEFIFIYILYFIQLINYLLL